MGEIFLFSRSDHFHFGGITKDPSIVLFEDGDGVLLEEEDFIGIMKDRTQKPIIEKSGNSSVPIVFPILKILFFCYIEQICMVETVRKYS